MGDKSDKVQPIQLLKVEENDTFSLDKDSLKNLLLDKSISEHNVVVISVAGPFRKGKSFLLSFFLRYLDAMCKRPSNSPLLWMDKQPSEGTSSWMGDENTPLTGFKWKLGVDRVTSGIQMWSEVFCATLPDGEKVAIILLDTQGLSDHNTSLAMNAKIYALSTMISSVQIYNLTQNVQENDLQMLKFFTDYASLSRKVPGRLKRASFQKLLFLIRDWCCGDDIPYGRTGGQQYMRKVLEVSDNQPEELRTIRKQIESAFGEVDCFLMPHPGMKVATKKEFDGRLSGIEQEFRDSLQELIPMLLTPTNLIPKEINGRRVKVRELVTYLEEYVDKLNRADQIMPKSIMDANAEISHQHAYESAIKFYKTRMELICGISTPAVEQETLMARHKVSHEDALNHFHNFEKFDDSSCLQSYRKRFEDETKGLYKFYQSDNNAKKQIEKLERQVQEQIEKSKYEKNIEEKVQKLLDELEKLKAERERSWFSKLTDWFTSPFKNILSIGS